MKVKYNKFKVDHAKVDAQLKSSRVASEDYEREISDFTERYQLLNELKDKVSLENEYLQEQNKYLLQKINELNKVSLSE